MTDVVERMRADLADLASRADDIQPADEATRASRGPELVALVEEHLHAMGEVVLPAVVQTLPEGPELSAAEGEVLDQMADAFAAVRDDPTDPTVMERAYTLLATYTQRWTTELLDALTRDMSEDVRRELGDAFERAKKQARDTRASTRRAS